MPLFPPASASTPGSLNWSGYYPGSTSNNWTTTNTVVGDWTVNGTIPAPTVLVNNGFGTVSKATSNLPGINFAAPRTGNLYIASYISFDPGAATVGTFGHTINMLESTTSNTLAIFTGGVTGTTPNANYQYQIVMTGIIPTTISTTYNFKLQAGSSATINMSIGGYTSAGAQLTFTMFYIS